MPRPARRQWSKDLEQAAQHIGLPDYGATVKKGVDVRDVSQGRKATGIWSVDIPIDPTTLLGVVHDETPWMDET